jgi:hypothetical protein
MTPQEATISSADPANAPAAPKEPRTALFPERDAGDLRRHWTDIQAAFVDEPRNAVRQADALVADVMKRLADTFVSERENLEKQWDRGDSATTEDSAWPFSDIDRSSIGCCRFRTRRFQLRYGL